MHTRMFLATRMVSMKVAQHLLLILMLSSTLLAGSQWVHAASSVSSDAHDQIVAAARGEIGYHESSGNCTKYGPCEPWCALFASWAWRQGGIDFHAVSVVEFQAYGEQNGTLHDGPGNPAPGDAILFKTRGGTGHHMGIIEQALPDGRIVSIEGNFNDQVKRVGPYWPSERRAYAIVSP